MKITITVITKTIITKTEKDKYCYLLEVFHCTPIKKWQGNKNERKTRGSDKRGNLLVFIYLTKTFDINFLPVGYPCNSNRLQSPLYFVQSTAANEVDGYNRRTNFSLTRWRKRELIHENSVKLVLPKKECEWKRRKFMRRTTMKKRRSYHLHFLHWESPQLWSSWAS